MRVAPNIFAKGYYLPIPYINVSILILMVSDQWQTTTEWLHFHVLRLNNNFSSLVLCAKQTIFLKNNIVLVHLMPFCSHTTKRKVWCFLVLVQGITTTPTITNRESPHLMVWAFTCLLLWLLVFKVVILGLSQVRSKHFLFQYVFVKPLLHWQLL